MKRERRGWGLKRVGGGREKEKEEIERKEVMGERERASERARREVELKKRGTRREWAVLPWRFLSVSNAWAPRRLDR